MVTYVEGQVCQLDAITSHGVHAGPVGVDVKRVSISVSNEVLEDGISDSTAATIGLDHQHLVG